MTMRAISQPSKPDDALKGSENITYLLLKAVYYFAENKSSK